MTDEQMERLVTQILARLQPPVLLMVTAAEGYRQEICHRMANCGQRLHIALDEGVNDAERWQALGEALPAHAWREGLPSEPYRALLVPFFDYPLAADLLSGTLRSPVARCLHEALLSGVPVLALRYHCDPASELNQLRGAVADSPYAMQMQAMLARLGEYGLSLCSMNELITRLAPDAKTPVTVDSARRYLTVTDVENNPALAVAPGAQLTDAAIDFLKDRKKNLTLNNKPGV